MAIKRSGQYLVALMAGSALGGVYYVLSRRLDLPEVETIWLPYALRPLNLTFGYDPALYETMLDFGFAMVVLFFFWRVTGRRS
jgi:hypothetical protein